MPAAKTAKAATYPAELMNHPEDFSWVELSELAFVLDTSSSDLASRVYRMGIESIDSPGWGYIPLTALPRILGDVEARSIGYTLSRRAARFTDLDRLERMWGVHRAEVRGLAERRGLPIDRSGLTIRIPAGTACRFAQILRSEAALHPDKGLEPDDFHQASEFAPLIAKASGVTMIGESVTSGLGHDGQAPRVWEVDLSATPTTRDGRTASTGRSCSGVRSSDAAG